MQSRMERYQTVKDKKYERVSKNTELYKKVYDDIYSDTSYKNMSIIDTAKEIDISKLKNMLGDKYDNKQYRTLDDYSIEDISLNDKTDYLEKNDRQTYDINKIIDEAKSKRAFIEEANEKQKYLDLAETRNVKYKKRYDELKEEEQELEELINTMTISVNNADADLMSDLIGDENTIVTKPVTADFDINNTSSTTSTENNLTNKLKKMDKTFYTDSNMFTKNDFEDFSIIDKQLKKSRIVSRIITILIILAIVGTAAYFALTKYILK